MPVDNKPAFPHDDRADYNDRPGMTLREYFAGQAISQIIATCANDATYGMTMADYFAARAYEIADAMLKAGREAE